MPSLSSKHRFSLTRSPSSPPATALNSTSPHPIGSQRKQLYDTFSPTLSAPRLRLAPPIYQHTPPIPSIPSISSIPLFNLHTTYLPRQTCPTRSPVRSIPARGRRR